MRQLRPHSRSRESVRGRGSDAADRGLHERDAHVCRADVAVGWRDCQEFSRLTSATNSYLAIISSARLLVRGPSRPIESMTTTMLPAINVNTPDTPKCARKKPMTNEVNTTESWLQE